MDNPLVKRGIHNFSNEVQEVAGSQPQATFNNGHHPLENGELRRPFKLIPPTNRKDITGNLKFC